MTHLKRPQPTIREAKTEFSVVTVAPLGGGGNEEDDEMAKEMEVLLDLRSARTLSALGFFCRFAFDRHEFELAQIHQSRRGLLTIKPNADKTAAGGQ